MGRKKYFREKSWDEKTELERFETLVDWVHEMVWGTPRRPEKKFEGMMTRAKGYTKEQTKAWLDSVKKPKRKRARKADGTYRGDDKSTPDVNEAWEE